MFYDVVDTQGGEQNLLRILYGLKRDIDRHGELDIPSSVVAKVDKYRDDILDLDYILLSFY